MKTRRPITDIIQEGQELLQQGQLETAMTRFEEVWRCADATADQLETALRGLTDAMDRQGRWHESETVYAERSQAIPKLRA